MKSLTRIGLTSRCGTSEPGTAATASANNSTSAVRIEVSWVHSHRSVPRTPSAGALQRVCSEVVLNKDDGAQKKTAMPRSHSHKSLLDQRERVKVSFGDDKTRFRMDATWGLSQLRDEIGRRFGIDDMAGFTVKYLDDDSEWVLLTCDAVLDECFEVSHSATIKLSLHPISRPAPS